MGLEGIGKPIDRKLERKGLRENIGYGNRGSSVTSFDLLGLDNDELEASLRELIKAIRGEDNSKNVYKDPTLSRSRRYSINKSTAQNGR